MADPKLMDRAFQRITRALVETGRAPHYAELGRALGLPVEDGCALLRDVMAAYPIGWLHPETDYIASFPGRTVRVDAACLDCGDPVTVEMRDGRITWVDPPGVVGHLAFGFGASRGRSYYL
jgi:hypothetical protein